MATTYYDWDDIEDNIDEEFDGNGSSIAEYTNEPTHHGRPISMTRDGQTHTFHDDGLGSVVALTDENGNVTDTYSHTAFGERVEHTGTTVNPYQWQGMNGYYTDEDGTVNVRRRQYNPAMARWYSADPLVFHLKSLMALLAPIDWNRYRYVWNRPTVLSDPSGLASCKVNHWDLRIQPCSFVFNSNQQFGKTFESTIKFSDQEPFTCNCCSYRQFITSKFTQWRDDPQMRGVQVLRQMDYQEDFGHDKDGTEIYYSHRDKPDFGTSTYSPDG